MTGLEEFMLFNACEDAREEQERTATTEYRHFETSQKHQKQFWEGESEEKTSYWDEDSSDDEY